MILITLLVMSTSLRAYAETTETIYEGHQYGIHYITMDGRAYDYTGTCTYCLMYAKTNETRYDVVNLMENVDGVTRIVGTHIDVSITNSTWRYKIVNGGKFYKDGVELQVAYEDSEMKFYKQTDNFYVADFKTVNFRVLFDGAGWIKIQIPQNVYDNVPEISGVLTNKVDGLPDNDFNFGNKTMTKEEWFNFWKMPYSPEGCLAENEMTMAESEHTEHFTKVAELLFEEAGIECERDGLNDSLVSNFANDVVYSEGNLLEGSKNLRLAAYLCSSVDNWREKLKLPLPFALGENEEYVNCSMGVETCPGVMKSSFPIEDYQCMEGFTCKSGTQFDGHTCVDPTKCSCSVDVSADVSIVKLNGEVWYRDNCTQRCECKATSKVECLNVTGCETGEACRKLIGFVYDCYQRDLCDSIECPHNQKCKMVGENDTECYCPESYEENTLDECVPEPEPTGEPHTTTKSHTTLIPTPEPTGEPNITTISYTTLIPTPEPTGEPHITTISYTTLIPTPEPTGEPHTTTISHTTLIPTPEPTGEPHTTTISHTTLIPTPETTADPGDCTPTACQQCNSYVMKTWIDTMYEHKALMQAWIERNMP